MSLNFFVLFVMMLSAFGEGLILYASLCNYKKNQIKPTRLAIDLGVAWGSFLDWHLKVLLGFNSCFLPFTFIYLINGDGLWSGGEIITNEFQIIILVIIAVILVMTGLACGYFVEKETFPSGILTGIFALLAFGLAVALYIYQNS